MIRFIFSLIFLLFLIAPATSQSPITAEIQLFQPLQTNASDKQILFAGVAFTNHSDKDIFIADAMKTLVSKNGGVLDVYKNGKLLSSLLWNGNRTDNFLPDNNADKNEIATPAYRFSEMSLLYGSKYIGELMTKINSANDAVAEVATKENANISSNYIKENCLFLKKGERSQLYFLEPLIANGKSIFSESGEYEIRYNPKASTEKLSYPEINQIAEYIRIYPKSVKCAPVKITWF